MLLKYKIIKLSHFDPIRVKAEIANESEKEFRNYKKHYDQVTNKAGFVLKWKKNNNYNDGESNIENGFDKIKKPKEIKQEIFERIKSKFISEIPLKHIILDCSCMNTIDNMGVDAIIQVYFIIF